MRKRRHYGKPPPSKEQVQAHYDFYAQVNKVVQQEGIKMNIELTKQELTVLKRILYAESKRFFDLADHAAAHSQDLIVPHHVILMNILTKIDPE